MKNNKKIKIIHLLSALDVGGMENGVVNLCNGLNTDLFESTIYCLNRFGPMLDRIGPDIEVMSFGFSEGNSFIRPLKVAECFNMIRPDIVHTHGWGAGLLYGYIAGRIARVPYVVNGEHGSFFETPMQLITQKFLLRRFDRLLSVSEVLRQRVIAKFDLLPSSISVIHNGVDTKRYNGFNLDKKNIIVKLRKEGLNISNDNYILGNVGSLRAVKNQIMLLQALSKIARHGNKNVIVLIVGEGPDREMLEERCNEMEIKDRVYFLGQRSDLPNLYNVFDVLVQCSFHEGMSNVILEAMSSCVPVICTHGCDEAGEIIKDGFNGILIENNSVDQLVEMVMLLNDISLRNKLANNANVFVTEEYSIDKMVSDYASFYNNLINKSSI